MKRITSHMNMVLDRGERHVPMCYGFESNTIDINGNVYDPAGVCLLWIVLMR